MSVCVWGGRASPTPVRTGGATRGECWLRRMWLLAAWGGGFGGGSAFPRAPSLWHSNLLCGHLSLVPGQLCGAMMVPPDLPLPPGGGSILPSVLSGPPAGVQVRDHGCPWSGAGGRFVRREHVRCRSRKINLYSKASPCSQAAGPSSPRSPAPEGKKGEDGCGGGRSSSGWGLASSLGLASGSVVSQQIPSPCHQPSQLGEGLLPEPGPWVMLSTLLLL